MVLLCDAIWVYSECMSAIPVLRAHMTSQSSPGKVCSWNGMGHRGRSRIFEKGGGGSILSLQQKKGGPGGSPTLGPMLKSLHRGPKGGGGSGPPASPPPGSAYGTPLDKLHEIAPIVNKPYTHHLNNCRDQSVFNRCRIGHSCVTSFY